MALDHSTVAPAVPRRWYFVRVVAITAAVGALMVLATAVFGWHGSPPPFDITIDPAGTMPF
jgi:hypothetical protein